MTTSGAQASRIGAIYWINAGGFCCTCQQERKKEGALAYFCPQTLRTYSIKHMHQQLVKLSSVREPSSLTLYPYLTYARAVLLIIVSKLSFVLLWIGCTVNITALMCVVIQEGTTLALVSRLCKEKCALIQQVARIVKFQTSSTKQKVNNYNRGQPSYCRTCLLILHNIN